MLAADSADLTEENQEKAQSNISAAQEILEKGQDLSVRLLVRLEEFETRRINFTNDDSGRQPHLPPLQIPKFKGHIWEWDQFWGIFLTTVHTQNISKIEKFTYLLDALQRPAKETVQNLQISAKNYDLAIDALKQKYGNDEAIIGRLLASLHSIQAHSSSIADQRRILEKIAPIISQLQQKGEWIDT
ncbi:hypothetical protein GCK32_015268 [Trichostrongylus colubriformis]